MLWGEIRVGDVILARSGPWMVTSAAHGDEFGYLLLDDGSVGTYESKAHYLLTAPVLRDGVVLNPETEGT